MIKIKGFKEIMPSANETAGYIIFAPEPIIIRNIENLPDGNPSKGNKTPFKIKLKKPAKKIIILDCTDPEPKTCVTTACLRA